MSWAVGNVALSSASPINLICQARNNLHDLGGVDKVAIALSGLIWTLVSWVSGVHGTKVARSRKCVTSHDSRSGDHSEETLFSCILICVLMWMWIWWLQEYDVSMLLLGARLTPVWNLDWTSFFGFGSNNRNLLWQLSLNVMLMKISSEVNYCLWILHGPWDYIMNSLWIRFCSGFQTILLRVSNYRGFWTRVATTKSWRGAPPKVRSVWSHQNTTKSKSRQNCNWY